MNDLITEFIEKDAIDSLNLLLASSDNAEIAKSAAVVASQFGSGFDISTDASVKKLITSFKKNLTLLIQKTWVDHSDVSLKEEILVKLEKYIASIEEDKWAQVSGSFTKILDDVIYLMFGAMAKSPDFPEYALRIDPEFGIFWWYVKSLPVTNDWSNEKNKAVMLIAMFFLANY
ncbi:hypothetical protein [Treponema ruminis]|uniref:Uncharacterized protein n=1 Tax=Treponema ruminis TaxID=744515 RepID=A0A7W8G6Q4_9SPIR|nr:hypothetical protein [Treponema ruminis]MBB5224848.1 hypothetical protein [Treponema ruminis]